MVASLFPSGHFLLGCHRQGAGEYDSKKTSIPPTAHPALDSTARPRLMTSHPAHCLAQSLAFSSLLLSQPMRHLFKTTAVDTDVFCSNTARAPPPPGRNPEPLMWPRGNPVWSSSSAHGSVDPPLCIRIHEHCQGSKVIFSELFLNPGLLSSSCCPKLVMRHRRIATLKSNSSFLERGYIGHEGIWTLPYLYSWYKAGIQRVLNKYLPDYNVCHPISSGSSSSQFL